MLRSSRLCPLFFLTVCALSGALACSGHCDIAQCQATNCSSEACQCCPACPQGVNQTCGGVNAEPCKPGLECLFSFEENQQYQATQLGTCQDVENVGCDVHTSQGCLMVSLSECTCLSVSSCHTPASFPFSTLQDCQQLVIQDPTLNESRNCSKDACGSSQVEKGRGPCPPDSYQIMDKSKNKHDSCECLPSTCQAVKCPEGFHPKIIRHGSKVPGACCTLFQCVNETAMCEYDMRLFASGDTWKTDDGCSRCSCENGLTFCQAVSCDTSKTCGYMTVLPGECCPVCNGCVAPSGKMYKNGVVWKEDDCTTCQCHEGKLTCQSELCQIFCTHPRTIPGQCCPTCDDGNSVEPVSGNSPVSNAIALDTCRGEKNRRYGLGEMWFDGCRHCYCHNGREMCAALSCPVLQCNSPRLVPGNCCPACNRKALSHKGERPYTFTVCQAVDGHYHVEGETWSLDPCTWCLCMQGQVLCEATQCPPTPCAHPTHHLGSCCSTCGDSGHPGLLTSNPGSLSGVCYGDDGATVYAEGHKWRPTPCQSCICVKGKVQCFQETCPPTDDCQHPMLVKHRCCPVCLGSKSSHSMHCLQDGHSYRDGERWTVNDCTSCVCLKGMQMCTEKICAPWCPRPLRLPGQCCPICEGESVDYNSQTHSHHHLSLAMVIICAAIMLLLVFVVIFLVLVVVRQRRVSTSSSLCPRQRPKSTNLELQGMSPCNKPLLESTELKKLHDQGSAVMKNIV